jgi:hypothetical protein
VNWLFYTLLVAVTMLLVFVAYWAGRNTGESTTFMQQRERYERLREENIALKLSNERLRGLAGYPEEKSSAVTVINSPGGNASADPGSAPM